jgi:hypothetical protein
MIVAKVTVARPVIRCTFVSASFERGSYDLPVFAMALAYDH